MLRVGYLPGAVAANHCPSPAAIIWESVGLPRRGTEVITVWLRLLFGSIVWRRSSRAGILELKAQSSFREPLDAPVGNFRTNQTKLNRKEPRSSQWGGDLHFFPPIFSSFFLFVPIPIRCIQRHKVFSLRLPLLHLWVIEKVAEQEEQFCDIAVSIFFTGLLLLKLRIVLMFNHIRNWMKNTIMWVNTPVPSGKKLKKIRQQVDLLSKWEIGLRNEYIILGKSHNPHYCLIPRCARRAASIAVRGSTHQIWATKTNKLNTFLSDCEWELKI